MITQVILIADSDPRKKVIGGIGIYTYHLAKYLTEKGVRVVFIGKKQSGKNINMLKNLTFMEATSKIGQSNKAFLQGLYKVARSFDIPEDAVIHAQRPDWLVPFAKYPNRKIVTLHGSHSKNVYLKKGYLIGKLYSMLEKKGLGAADHIVSVSKENKRYYEKLYQCSPSITAKLQVIPVGVTLPKIKKADKARYGLKKADKAVVFIGRFEKEKNLKLLINAAHQAQLPLLLVGEGAEKEMLQNYAKQIKSKTIFHKAVLNEQIPQILSCASVFALSSLYEGLPIVVIEALASGIPVVSTNVGDVGEVVINGKTGYVVDAKSMPQKLQYTAKHSNRFRKNCLAMAKNYSWNIVGKRIMEIYKQ